LSEIPDLFSHLPLESPLLDKRAINVFLANKDALVIVLDVLDGPVLVVFLVKYDLIDILAFTNVNLLGSIRDYMILVILL